MSGTELKIGQKIFLKINTGLEKYINSNFLPKKKKDTLNSLLCFIRLWLSYAQKFALMVVVWKLDWLGLNVESGRFFRK